MRHHRQPPYHGYGEGGGSRGGGLGRGKWCLLSFAVVSFMALVSLGKVANRNFESASSSPITRGLSPPIMERAVSSPASGGLKGYHQQPPIPSPSMTTATTPSTTSTTTTNEPPPATKRGLKPDVIKTYLDQISTLTKQKRVADDLATSLKDELKQAKGEVSRLEQKVQASEANGKKEEKLEKEVEELKSCGAWKKQKETMEKKLESLTRELDGLKAAAKVGPSTSDPVAIPLSTLPSFTTDHRFYVMGGVITRDEVEAALVVDTLFLGKKLYEGEGQHGVESLGDQWQMGKIASTKNLAELAGENRFSCRIAGVGVIEGTLIPTGTTVDGNVNDMIDVLRCKLPSNVAHKDLTIEIIEEKKREGTYDAALPLISYVLPWKDRTTGYITFRPESSTLDPWRETKDDIHMCVPGQRSEFKCPWVETVLEFIEYHSQMGVSHFYFGVDYEWGSEDMNRFLRVVGQYIDEGKVSVSSLSISGAVVGPEMKKIYHINQCILYAKSMTRFIGIWDTDEFLVPREPPSQVGPKNLVELVGKQLKQANQSEDDMCYLLLTSYAHAGPLPPAPLEHVWLGQIFAETREDTNDDTWQKSLLSSRNIYYMGYHLPGACRSPKRDWAKGVATQAPDAVRVDKKEAAMFHFRSKVAGSVRFFVSEKMEPSEYSLHYFPSVVEGLKRRKVDTMIESICQIRPVMEPVPRRDIGDSSTSVSRDK